jgi:hypothetical protein
MRSQLTEMCDAGIADATLPRHLESAEVAQVLKHDEPAIGQLPHP